jgi:hypothetical protein
MPSPLPPEMIGMRNSLQHHLQFNHFPPVHGMFVPIAEAAIEVAVEAVEGNLDLLDDTLELPNGVVLPVQQIMDELHLWDYVSPEVM